jgi:hypothetical protein
VNSYPSTSLRQGHLVLGGFHECGVEPSSAIKGGEFFGEPSFRNHCQLLDVLKLELLLMGVYFKYDSSWI